MTNQSFKKKSNAQLFALLDKKNDSLDQETREEILATLSLRGADVSKYDYVPDTLEDIEIENEEEFEVESKESALIREAEKIYEKICEDNDAKQIEALAAIVGDKDLEDLNAKELKAIVDLPGKVVKTKSEAKVAKAKSVKVPKEHKQDMPRPGSKSEQIYEMLKTTTKSNYQISQELGTYPSVALSVQKRYNVVRPEGYEEVQKKRKEELKEERKVRLANRAKNNPAKKEKKTAKSAKKEKK